MILFLDCEYNDFQGDLISMALVDLHGTCWYQVLECKSPSPWIAANVMPVLFKAPVALAVFQSRLGAFLARYELVTIVADWPEDISHFCRAIITGPGTRINTPRLEMLVDSRLHTGDSLVPHNALEDARSMRLLALGILAEVGAPEPVECATEI